MGNVISRTSDPALCRLLRGLLLVFQQNGHKISDTPVFKFKIAVQTLLQCCSTPIRLVTRYLNLKLLRTAVNSFTLNSAFCKPVCMCDKFSGRFVHK
jgi:hypothetical protein